MRLNCICPAFIDTDMCREDANRADAAAKKILDAVGMQT